MLMFEDDRQPRPEFLRHLSVIPGVRRWLHENAIVLQGHASRGRNRSREIFGPVCMPRHVVADASSGGENVSCRSMCRFATTSVCSSDSCRSSKCVLRPTAERADVNDATFGLHRIAGRRRGLSSFCRIGSRCPDPTPARPASALRTQLNSLGPGVLHPRAWRGATGSRAAHADGDASVFGNPACAGCRTATS